MIRPIVRHALEHMQEPVRNRASSLAAVGAALVFGLIVSWFVMGWTDVWDRLGEYVVYAVAPAFGGLLLLFAIRLWLAPYEITALAIQSIMNGQEAVEQRFANLETDVRDKTDAASRAVTETVDNARHQLAHALDQVRDREGQFRQKLEIVEMLIHLQRIDGLRNRVAALNHEFQEIAERRAIFDDARKRSLQSMLLAVAKSAGDLLNRPHGLQVDATQTEGAIAWMENIQRALADSEATMRDKLAGLSGQ